MPTRLRPFLLVLVLVIAAAGLTACGGDSDTPAGAGGTKIVVASLAGGPGAFSESEGEVLAHLYGKALENAGVEVEYRIKVGDRAAAVAALEKGEIDMVPEYLGGLLGFFDPSETRGRPVPESLEALRAAAPKGITVADASPAAGGEVIAVTKDLATSRGLETISDLKKLPAPVILAAPIDCATSETCFPGLRSVYGVDVGLNPIGLEAGGPDTKKALQDGTAHIGRLYSSDPDTGRGGKYVVLEDDLLVQRPGNIVPVLRTVKATPAIRAVLNHASKALTTEKLAELNEKIEKDGEAPAAVADGFAATEKL